MPRTNIQRDRNVLWNSVTKLKFLSRISNSQGVIIPESFLNALQIDKETLLIVGLNTIEESIIVQKVKDPKLYKVKRGKNEEADYTITE
jgi:antitoxin component of MazEF toxin-antitoxin module